MIKSAKIVEREKRICVVVIAYISLPRGGSS